MNPIAQKDVNAIAVMPEAEVVRVLQSSLYPGASPDSIRMVIGYCKASGLDPFQKPVHIVPMWDSKAGQMRDVVMPGVGLYRTQAARTGCAGISEPEFGPDRTEAIGGQQITFPAWCRVTVKRRQANGAVDEFTAREFWLENYAVKGGKEKSIAPNAMWTKRPYGQIAKCAEAQALRKAFPEIGSQPTAEEMEGKGLEEGTGPLPVVERVPEPTPVWPAAAFVQQLPRWAKAVEAGMKTAADIEALASSKGALTGEQLAAIRALKPAAPAADAAVDPDTGEFAADYAAAEGVQA